MSVTTLDFSNRASQYAVDTPPEWTVETRQFWLGDWVSTPIGVDSVVWNCGPRYGISHLSERYGERVRSSALETVTPRSLDKYFVHISGGFDDLAGGKLTRDWYGTIERERDEQFGSRDVRRGRKRWIAYDLLYLLDRYPIQGFRYWLGSDPWIDWAAAGISFNEDGRPNKHSGGDPAGVPIFETSIQGADYWSTKDIVRYVLHHNTIRVAGSRYNGHLRIGRRPPHWRLDGADWLPDDDQPIVKNGPTAGAILRNVLRRQRLFVYWAEVDNSSPQEIVLRVATANEDTIEYGNNKRIPSNSTQYIIDDHLGRVMAAHVLDYSSQYDQVIVEGARRRSVFSLSDADGNWFEGWTSGDETDYDAGASGAGDYPAATEIDKRRRRDADARSDERLQDVYSRFGLDPSGWDMKAGDGIGGTQHPVFLADTAWNNPDDYEALVRPWPGDVSFETTLPLLQGIDYTTGQTISVGAVEAEKELPPIVVMPIPEAILTKWCEIDKVGAAANLPKEVVTANRKWSGRVIVPTRKHEAALTIKVTGQPQHVLSDHDMPLSHDIDIQRWDWDGMIVTVSVREQRRARVVFPSFDEVRASLNPTALVRELVISAGEGYQLNFMADGTVVGVDGESSTLQRAPAAQYIRDDRPALLKIARLAYSYYSQARTAVALTTTAPIASPWLGSLVRQIIVDGDGTTVDTRSVVTQVSVATPINGKTRQTILTSFAELDPVGMI